MGCTGCESVHACTPDPACIDSLCRHVSAKVVQGTTFALLVTLSPASQMCKPPTSTPGGDELSQRMEQMRMARDQDVPHPMQRMT